MRLISTKSDILLYKPGDVLVRITHAILPPDNRQDKSWMEDAICIIKINGKIVEYEYLKKQYIWLRFILNFEDDNNNNDKYFRYGWKKFIKDENLSQKIINL